MDYMKLKLAIYESYGNGEMTSEACSHLIDNLDMKYGESIAEEAVNAENDFINASLKVFTESAGEEALTEAVKDFGAKIKAAWEKFKAWIKKIIEKILNLGKKPEQQKAEIKVPNALDKALGDAKKWIAKLGGAKTVGSMAAAVAGIVSSTALIIKNRKLKETMSSKTYEYEKFKKEQADLVKSMYDAATKAQDEITHLKIELGQAKQDKEHFANIAGAQMDEVDKIQKELADTKKKLADAEKELSAAKNNLTTARQLWQDEKEAGKAKDQKISDLNKQNHITSENLKNATNTIKNMQEIDKIKSSRIDDLKKKVSELEKKLDGAKKSSSVQKRSSTDLDANITDSKILSASTGLVNAITQTVVSLLPQYSSRTTDDIDAKIQSKTRSDGSITVQAHENPDMKLLYEATSVGRKTCRLIRCLIENKFMADDSIISDYLKKIDDLTRYNSDINKSIDAMSKGFKNKLKAEYNFDTIDGIKAFANDYSSGTGLIGSMIKDAVNRAKSVTSIYNKYNINSKRVEYSKAKADGAIKDYGVVYQSYNICDETYHIIRNMATELKDKIHNVNDKY